MLAFGTCISTCALSLPRGNYLNGGVIEHFLPGIVELPLMRIVHKLLLGKGHRLLGGNVVFCKVCIGICITYTIYIYDGIHMHFGRLTIGTPELQCGRLTVELRLTQAFARLVIAAGFLNAGAQLLGEQLQATRRLVEQYAKRTVGLLPSYVNCGLDNDDVANK